MSPCITPIDEGGAHGRAALVVLNGASVAEVTRARRWLRRFAGAPTIVAVDGGLETLRRGGLAPTLVVGDGDSSSRWPATAEAVRLPRDKEISDFGAALAALRRRARVVAVAGLLGGRLDHEWANVAEAARHAAAFDLIVAPTARGAIGVTAVGAVLEDARGATFSLLAQGGDAVVSVVGAHWDLRRRRIRPGSHGLSNRGRADRVRVRVAAGTVALVAPV